MIHRAKPLRGKEERNAYRDCTFFGISDERYKDGNSDCLEDCMFTLTSGYSDKLFPMGVNFSPSSCEDFSVIIAAVNAFIDSVQGDIEIDANARVYPLFCTGHEYENQCREFETSLLQGTDYCTADSNDYLPYYVKASAVQIIRTTDEIHTCEGVEESAVGSTEEATAVCISSIPVVVLTHI